MHFANAIAINHNYRTSASNVSSYLGPDYFHSFLLTFHAKALFGQGQVENCLQELNKALEIH